MPESVILSTMAKDKKNTTMASPSSASSDPRFSKFSTDPKFRPVPKKQRKVAIDERFKGMFQEERFVSRTRVDKRGRRAKTKSSDQEYRRYYRMEEEDSGEEERPAKKKKKSEKAESDNEEEEETPVDSGSEDEDITPAKKTATDDKSPLPKKKKLEDPKIKRRLKDMSVDYARGEGDLDSDSSSSGSSSEESSDEEEKEEEEEEEAFDGWGELDKDAERSEESTRRLAVCNMDWDRVGAEDVFAALSSFCPVQGRVERVRVFVSEFGRKRLEEEDRWGETISYIFWVFSCSTLNNGCLLR